MAPPIGVNDTNLWKFNSLPDFLQSLVEVLPAALRGAHTEEETSVFDNPAGAAQVFDFEEIANHLLEQGVANSPSEMHGCLCGLLAAGADPSAEAGLDGVGRALNLDLHGELAGLAMQLYAASNAALRDEAFEFYPLLPDDEADIEVRTQAVAGWSRGFLAGYAQAASRQAGQDTGEILRDITAIAEASVDPDAEAEESESSLVEIVEYLRFAALNIFLDHQPEEPPGETPSGRH